MAIKTTLAEAHAKFAALCDEVVSSRDVAIISRGRRPKVALIAADELRSLMETVHLLRSPKNAMRLFSALSRALDQRGAPDG